MRNGKLKYGLAVFLAVVLLLSAGSAPAGANNSLTDLKKNQENIQKEISRYKNMISQTTRQISSVSSEMQKIDQSISQREAEISGLEKIIADKEAEIARLENGILMRQMEYSRRQGVFEARLRLIYESGNVEFLEVLVASTDMTDFLVRFELMSRIAGSDIAMLEDLEAERLALEEERANIAGQKEQLSGNVQELASSREQLEQVKNQKAQLQNKLLTEKEAAEKALREEEESNKQVEKMIKEFLARQASSGKYSGGRFAWPTPGHTRVTSDYGWRIHPITKTKSMHTGVDIAAPRNASIVAPADGKVIFAGWMGAYGNCTIVDHGGGLTTMYAHQNKLGTSAGTGVVRGEQIGYVGTTGTSTGNHLHFEVRVKSAHTSPWAYLR